MARPKGFKLSPEQKQKMQEGRIKKMEKNREGMIGQEDTRIKKLKRDGFTIIGYAIDPGRGQLPYPIFSSERKSHSGGIYKSVEAARESRK